MYEEALTTGFQDQPWFPLNYRTNVTTLNQLANPAVNQQAINDYLRNQTGPLDAPAGNIVGQPSPT